MARAPASARISTGREGGFAIGALCHDKRISAINQTKLVIPGEREARGKGTQALTHRKCVRTWVPFPRSTALRSPGMTTLLRWIAPPGWPAFAGHDTVMSGRIKACDAPPPPIPARHSRHPPRRLGDVGGSRGVSGSGGGGGISVAGGAASFS